MSRSDRLSKIEERAGRATPGPWHVRQIDTFGASEIANQPHLPDSMTETEFDAAWDDWSAKDEVVCELTEGPDAEFIAHSREDVPFLISKLETERAETIEVLENYLEFRPYWERHLWWHEKAKPLLDKLKGATE